MATGMTFPFVSVTFDASGETYTVGEGTSRVVKEIRMGQGMPGFLLIVIVFEETDCADCPKEMRFMAPPTGVLFEVGEPVEVQMPVEVSKPTLLVPNHRFGE